MRRLLRILIVVMVLQSLTAAEKKSEETFGHQFLFKGEASRNTLIIKNFWGDIRVTGQETDRINVRIIKKIWARSEDQFNRAGQDVALQKSEEEDCIELYVNGPFRNQESGRYWHEGQYTVTYHFDVEVPYETQLDLETVNDGSIRIEHMRGLCSAKNINGPIDAMDIHEIGEIYALNRPVHIYFDQNPVNDCIVGSLNGDVCLYFLRELSADFIVETLNGDVYSDFPAKKLAGETYDEKQSHGLHRYKTGHRTKFRIGKGGAEIFWKGFNGDLLIKNRTEL
ncbi:hypothetical protein JW948_13345 [bacterium]|nr:hypothetical protein [bacterium]